MCAKGQRGLTPSEIKERTKELQLKITQNKCWRELSRQAQISRGHLQHLLGAGRIALWPT